jgi:hypothetical protein
VTPEERAEFVEAVVAALLSALAEQSLLPKGPLGNATQAAPEPERYKTAAELASHLKVGKSVVYRHINARTPVSDRWPCSRTSNSPKAPVLFSPAQVAVIEEMMKRNGERGAGLQPTPQPDARAIARGLRRLNRHAVVRDTTSKGLDAV